MKRGQMLIITAIVLLVSLGAVLLWNEGGITKEVTIGQTQSDIFETFVLGQTINNYIGDSAELSRCNALHKTALAWNEEAIPESNEIKEYFEDRFREYLLIYIADFPPIKKTSLSDEHSLYTNLFFQSDFDYENKIIKGGPQKIIYTEGDETEEFTDFLEILSQDGYVYKFKPIYSINFPTEFFDRLESVRSWTSGTPEGFESVVNEQETIISTEEGVEDTISPTGRVIATTDLKCLGKNVQIIFTP
tara:strand:- start:33 stop:773 length:741 start_codon:yes stop_codon:yes gene_type:complete